MKRLKQQQRQTNESNPFLKINSQLFCASLRIFTTFPRSCFSLDFAHTRFKPFQLFFLFFSLSLVFSTGIFFFAPSSSSAHHFCVFVYLFARLYAREKVSSSQKILLIFCNYLLLITFSRCFRTNQRRKLICVPQVSFGFVALFFFFLVRYASANMDSEMCANGTQKIVCPIVFFVSKFMRTFDENTK